MPIWIANFVLGEYGTGAVMGVPAHDERDYEFARKYGLAIRVVVRPADDEPADPATMTAPVSNDGVLVNSGPWDGLPSDEARAKLTADAEKRGIGEGTVQYRLKDWGISRQRYWGTPIPMIHCPVDGVVAVPEDQLPVTLPKVATFSGRGDSPLAQLPEFVNVTCPKCGGPARRETDTMDTFVDSSWYFYRFADAHNDKLPFDPAKVAYWCPVRFLQRRRRARDSASDLLAVFLARVQRSGHDQSHRAVRALAHPGHGAQGRRGDVQVEEATSSIPTR